VAEARIEVDSAEIRGTSLAGVDAFLGIRYARAMRLQRPVPEPLVGRIDAFAFGPAAPQPRGGPGLVPGLEPGGALSEDCLSLNVWSPHGARSLPVVVWIHGGSFLIGAASSPTYDGSTLASEGVVVVSVQYRLGAFGFLDLTDHGGADIGMVPNAGLHDVVCALDWVRAHIGAFGGDSQRITAIGESAGGGVILHLLGAPGRARMFDRAIVQSGSTGRTFESAAASGIAARVLALAGCANAAEFERAPVDTIIAASVAVQADPEAFAVGGLMPFHPSIDASLVHLSPDAALEAGQGRGCDLILGVTRDEMQLFVMDTTLEAGRLHRRVAKYLGVDDTTAEAVCDAYASVVAREGRVAEGVAVWGAIYSDREMVVPARRALDRHAAVHPATFGYRFDWPAPARGDGRLVGAAHGTDIPFTFGNFSDEWLGFLGRDRADEMRGLSAAIRSSWIAFATTGDPSNSIAGAWPRWDAGRRAVVLNAATAADVGIEITDDPLGARASALVR
jgi:para-nitrobenzyl esterase